MMLLSYTDKEKSDKKNVIVLINIHDKVKVTNDKQKKPHVHVMYDHIKGGVDIVDLLSTIRSTRIKSKRWSLNALVFVLGTCRTNAKTIVGDNDIQVTNFEFRYELSKALVLPSIQRRFKNQNSLQIKILHKMRHVLNIQEVNHRRQIKNQRTKSGCCFRCVDEIVGTVDYKNKREKLNNKLKSKCHLCSQFLCKVHQKSTRYVCEDCFVEDE